MKYLICLLAVTAVGCAASGGDAASGVSQSPGPAPAPSPAPVSGLAPGAVTVKVKNALVGQIRQIAMGADGWTAIISDDLVVDCVATSSTEVLCTRYSYEPYPYTAVAP